MVKQNFHEAYHILAKILMAMMQMTATITIHTTWTNHAGIATPNCRQTGRATAGSAA